MAIGFGVVLLVAASSNLYQFLSGTQRVATSIMVVDGGMPVQMLPLAADEFRSGHYREVWIVRGIDTPGVIEPDDETDDYVAEILEHHGIPREQVHSILFSCFKKDRTFAAANTLKGRWEKQGSTPPSFNVVTAGARARRTQLLFKRAWKGDVTFGVVGLDDPAYDGHHWWRSSEGMRQVLFGALTYGYLLVYFGPIE